MTCYIAGVEALGRGHRYSPRIANDREGDRVLGHHCQRSFPLALHNAVEVDVVVESMFALLLLMFLMLHVACCLLAVGCCQLFNGCRLLYAVAVGLNLLLFLNYCCCCC